MIEGIIEQHLINLIRFKLNFSFPEVVEEEKWNGKSRTNACPKNYHKMLPGAAAAAAAAVNKNIEFHYIWSFCYKAFYGRN